MNISPASVSSISSLNRACESDNGASQKSALASNLNKVKNSTDEISFPASRVKEINDKAKNEMISARKNAIEKFGVSQRSIDALGKIIDSGSVKFSTDLVDRINKKAEAEMKLAKHHN